MGGNRLFRTALLLGILQVLSWISIPPLSAAFKRVGPGDAPPPFAMQDLEGKEWRSEDLFGRKVTVVVFWATWSPRSREILEGLEKLGAELGPDAFQVVAINAEHTEITASDRTAIAGLVKGLNLSAVVLLDQGLVAYNDYGTMALPSSLVVNTEGKVAFDLAGYPMTMRSDLDDAIRKALGMPTSVEMRPPEGYKPKNHALMYYNFGKRLMEKGQEEKAEAQLLTSVERDPEFVKPRVMLGIYLKKTGRLEEAMEQFRTVKELDYTNEEALYQAAAVSLRAADFATAQKLFGELHEEFPEREEFAYGYALSQKYQEREDEFLQAKAKAAGLLPAPAHILYELGGVAAAQGDLGEAAVLYRRAIEGALQSKRWR